MADLRKATLFADSHASAMLIYGWISLFRAFVHTLNSFVALLI